MCCHYSNTRCHCFMLTSHTLVCWPCPSERLTITCFDSFPNARSTVWLPCLAFHKCRSTSGKVLTAALPLCQASGRQWKEAGQRAGTLKSQNVSSSWNEKMRIKAETKIFRENRAQAIATRKAKLQVRVPLQNSCTNAWLGFCQGKAACALMTVGTLRYVLSQSAWQLCAC